MASAKFRTNQIRMARNNVRDGFSLTFTNGWEVSVQWSPSVTTYGGGHGIKVESFEGDRISDSTSAEVGIFHDTHCPGGEIKGWQTPSDVAAIIAEVSQR